MMSSGLVQRKKAREDEEESATADQDLGFQQESYGNGQDLTIMEEIVLLGLKDSEVKEAIYLC